MASASQASSNHIKIEDSPMPEAPFAESLLLPGKLPAPAHPRDPDNFMRRCSGLSKKTNLRCSAVIGKRSQKDTHPTFLPTCSSHRHQQSLAGWCQLKRPDGEICGRLFRWRPPYFELCDHHQGHPGTPCYLLKQLPLELRCEVYRYLLLTESIGSSTAAIHQENYGEIFPSRMFASRAANRHHQPPPRPFVPSGLPSPLVAAFPMRLTHLLLVSRQIHNEVKDLLFSVVTFKIDVRKDGAFMCGRRLLEPKRADGSSHVMAEEADKAKKRFLKSFDWASVKNYTVDILLENWGHAYPHINRGLDIPWDEEVEIYDIRDYVSVVVSGILAKSKKLCKLQVRLGLDDFQWDEYQTLSNSKLLFEPFERLRNVRQPSIGGVFDGRPNNNSVYSVISGTSQIDSSAPGHYDNCCSVPSLLTNKPMLAAGMPAFDAYAADWKRQISSESSKAITEEPPIRKMFAEFRNFYTELANYIPDVTFRSGRHTFLHRARVAREQEDVIAFRGIRNELIHYWEAYKADEERKKREMNKRLGKLLESDMYPSHEWEDVSPARPQSPSGQTAQSPVLLDSEKMAQEGIPMTGNSGETLPYTSEQCIHVMQVQQQHKQSQAHAPSIQHRLMTINSTSAPRGSHPTLSDYAHQHQQVLQAQQQAEQQAQQHLHRQIQQHQMQQQQYQARYHALCQQSRHCLARLNELKNQESMIRQQVKQALSALRTEQHPTNTAALQQTYRKQAHSITLAVLEAQRKYDKVEKRKRDLKMVLDTERILDTEWTLNTQTTATMGTTKNTAVKVEVKEENSPDTLVNEDLHLDSSWYGDVVTRVGEAATAGGKRKGGYEVRGGGEGVQEGVGVGVGVPGPSTTKKRRVDSGFYETVECSVQSELGGGWGGGGGDADRDGGWEGAWVGKGKGKGKGRREGGC